MIGAVFAKLATRAAVALILVASMAAALPPPGLAAVSQKAPPATVTQAARLQLFKLPMRFEPNQGQSNSLVKFVARGNGYGLFLTKDEAVIALSRHTIAKPVSMAPGVPRVAPSSQDVADNMATAGVQHYRVCGDFCFCGNDNGDCRTVAQIWVSRRYGLGGPVDISAQGFRRSSATIRPIDYNLIELNFPVFNHLGGLSDFAGIRKRVATARPYLRHAQRYSTI
jgi:hypothetical protein